MFMWRKYEEMDGFIWKDFGYIISTAVYEISITIDKLNVPLGTMIILIIQKYRRPCMFHLLLLCASLQMNV